MSRTTSSREIEYTGTPRSVLRNSKDAPEAQEEGSQTCSFATDIGSGGCACRFIHRQSVHLLAQALGKSIIAD